MLVEKRSDLPSERGEKPREGWRGKGPDPRWEDRRYIPEREKKWMANGKRRGIREQRSGLGHDKIYFNIFCEFYLFPDILKKFFLMLMELWNRLGDFWMFRY